MNIKQIVALLNAFLFFYLIFYTLSFIYNFTRTQFVLNLNTLRGFHHEDQTNIR